MSLIAEHLTVHLGDYHTRVDTAVREMADDHIIERLWESNAILRKPDTTDISQHPGWLQRASTFHDEEQLQRFVRDVQAEGYSRAVILGTGSAGLAPVFFSHLHSADQSALSLAVLDSTDPGAVTAYTQWCDPARTLFVVADTSGTTGETLSLCKHFYNHVAANEQAAEVGQHFVAVTAPQSPLADLAARYDFREVFLADPAIAGRYAALSPFSLVPAALTGVDVPRLLAHAEQMQHACGVTEAVEANPGVQLGAILSELTLAGRDKVTVRTSATLSAFGTWMEHLLIESTGTGGAALIPIVHEPLGLPNAYGSDRLFVHLGYREDDEQQQEQILSALAAAGHPVVHWHLQDWYEIGGQMLLWEVAAAVARHRLGMQPLAQPQAGTAEPHARDTITLHSATRALTEDTAAATFDGIRLYGMPNAHSPEEALQAFLEQGQPGDYVAIQAYLLPPFELPMTREDTPELTRMRQEAVELRTTLMSMCARIRDRYGLAATFDYGPRSLDSTGQLHTGEAGRGLFLQFTADTMHDVPIPAEAGELTTATSFAALQAEQALRDYQTIRESGQRLIRLHLGTQVVERLRQLNRALV